MDFFCMRRYIKTGILIALSLMILTEMGIYINNGIIQADASYYLGVSQSILEGYVPYKDFKLEYTPLTFYLMCIPMLIFGDSYSVCLAFMYAFHILNGVAVYMICRKLAYTKFISSFSALFSLLLCYYFGGEVYILEPYVLFWGLLAIYTINKKENVYKFIAGLLCFCAFWSKQYGLGFIFLCLAYQLLSTHKTKDYLSIAYLLSGFFLGLIMSLTFLHIQGVRYDDISIISGDDYERTGGYWGIVRLWRTVLSIVPMILLSLFFCLVKWKTMLSNKYLVVSLCGIFGFMLQWYVRTYWHYLILMVPFFILLLLKVCDLFTSKRMKTVLLVLYVLSIVRPGYVSILNSVSILKKRDRQTQEMYAQEILNIIPIGTDAVYSSGDALPVNLLNKYKPPFFKKYGYKNGFVETGKETIELIEHSTFCIISGYALNDKIKYNQQALDILSKHFERQCVQLEEVNKPWFVYKRITVNE